MNFDLTEEQEMLRESAERLLRESYDANSRMKLLKTEDGFSREHWKQYAELGWLGVSLPEDVGGLGWSIADTCVLIEALGGSIVLEPYLTTAVLGAQLVDRSGSESHRQALLPALIGGELMLALAHHEPGNRYDNAAVATTARKSGDGWVISGTKQLVYAAPSADKFIVSAKPEGAAGFALFLVERDNKGLELFQYELIDGTRAADIRFKDVTVPADALFVDATKALALLDEVLDITTICATAEALGTMEAALTITSEYIKTRNQFGQPIGKFQALQHRMAEMFVETQQTRSILFRGLSLLDSPPDERRRAVSFTKAHAGDSSFFVGANGIQLHGGYGMTEEYQISHVFKKLVTFQKSWGDTDWHYKRAVA
jgi:alkylation response protein AidB-like acyl-CoA dehydrogenase